MPRYIRNTVILAKVETTAGTDATPTGAANALLVTDLSITPLEATNVDRALIRPYFGGSEQLVGYGFVRASFSVEMAGSGTAATAPAWGALLQGCAMAEASLVTPARVEYTPVSTSLKTLTIYWYDDGVLHSMVGSMGNCRGSAKVGERPMLMFEFQGAYVAPTATANASPTLTSWKTPTVVRNSQVTDITLGGTYSAGAITGGTVYPSTGVEFDFGNSVQFTALASREQVDITDRAMTGRMALDLTAAQEVTQMTNVRANTTQSLAFTIGTATGNKVLIFAPVVQLINPRKEDLNGTRLIGFDLRLVPSSGNDEIRIVSL